MSKNRDEDFVATKAESTFDDEGYSITFIVKSTFRFRSN